MNNNDNQNYDQNELQGLNEQPPKKKFFSTPIGIITIVLICLFGIPVLLFGACMMFFVISWR